MQRGVAFLTVLALILVTVGASVTPTGRSSSALAFQDASPIGSPLPMATPVASAPETPVPVALPTAAELGLVFPAGIDVTPLAVGTIDQLPADATLLRLERVSVPAGEELAMRTPTAPELLFGELGTVTIVDAIGLSAPLASGGQVMLTAGSGYTLRNGSSGPASLLRLSIGSPSVPDTSSQVLLESQLSAVPTTPASLVLGLSSWQPGADTGSYTAAGPIGLLINSGTLTITSPSGLEAPLGPRQGLVFPAGVPQRERNAGNEMAQALLIAVVPMGQPAIAAVPTATPLPTPTPLPTSTPEPTATPLPTPTSTPSPTATSEPTATPQPTATPTPSPTPTPVPEPTLYQVDSSGGFEQWGSLSGWTVLDGQLINDGSNCTALVAPVDLSNVRDYAVEAEIQLITSMDDEVGFGVFARWNGGERYWGGLNRLDRYVIHLGSQAPDYYSYDAIAGNQATIDNDWHTYRLSVEKNQSRLYVDGSEVARATDNRLLSPGDAGIWCRGPVQLGVRSFKIVPLGNTASAVPRQSADVELAGIEQDYQSLFGLLPTDSDALAGLAATEERQRTLEELAQAFENPEEMTQLFQQWGWQENAYREFAPPNAIPLSPFDLDYARVGIHRFGGGSQSAAAAEYIAQDVLAGIGGDQTSGPPMGEGSILLSGQNENGNWVNLLVYQGPYVISVSTSSPQGDSTGAAIALAETVLAKLDATPIAWDAGAGSSDLSSLPSISEPLVFGAEDWQGGLYRSNAEWYGRPWIAVYGAFSEFPIASLTFWLEAQQAEQATLLLTGLDDEFPANTTIEIAVNGVPIYTGPSPFSNWDGNMATQGVDAAWQQASFSVPADLLVAGANQLTVANLEPTANYNGPPWVLLADAAIETG